MVLTSERLMWIPRSKLSREGMVNSPPCAKVKKETARHDLTDVLRGHWHPVC